MRNFPILKISGTTTATWRYSPLRAVISLQNKPRHFYHGRYTYISIHFMLTSHLPRGQQVGLLFVCFYEPVGFAYHGSFATAVMVESYLLLECDAWCYCKIVFATSHICPIFRILLYIWVPLNGLSTSTVRTPSYLGGFDHLTPTEHHYLVCGACISIQNTDVSPTA